MAAFRCILMLAALAAHATAAEVRASSDVKLTLEPVLTGGFEMTISKDGESKVSGLIGRTLVQPYTIEKMKEGTEVHVGFQNANLTVFTYFDESVGANGVKFVWHAPSQIRLEDCLSFGSDQWYGGPMQIQQRFPIQKAPRPYAAYVSTENDNGAIVERYWLNSAGAYVYVHPEVPLFVDYDNLAKNHLCFGAQIAEPFSNKRERTILSYDIWLLSDAKTAHKHAAGNYLGKPSNVPDFRMVQHPIWSTWAQYSRDINGSNLIDFAEEIKMHGFNNSQFEVDDFWETCYGSLTVDVNKFPNFTHFVDELKNMGYRVTLWIHPFINKNCDPVYTEALTKGYLVLNEQGSPDVYWWNSNGTTGAYVDFTNPEAAEWWYQRVKALQDTHGIDSFKFDAGETSFSPQVAVQNGDIEYQPHHIVDAYVKTCARFGNMVEVRAGFRTQQLPIFVRMVDRDSIWGFNNGLSTIITTTFQMNLNGYTLVLPDMIGGNGFNLNHDQAMLPTKELFIRWVQANTFLPVMQFSFAPWNFGDETVAISKKFTELHAEYADKIYAAMQASVDHGTPVNGPLWWLDPTDQEAQIIEDEYLLGEDIIVAPVLVEGATSRDVYLPAGTWLEAGDADKRHEGPVWLRSVPAPIDVLLYYVRDSDSSPDSASATPLSMVLIFAGIMMNALYNL